MDNILRQIETEEVIFYKENQYSQENRKLFRNMFDELKSDGTIRSEFDDPIWTCYSGIRTFSVDFTLNDVEYTKHIGSKFGISKTVMTDMLKCFCLYSCGEYVFSTIQIQMSGIKKFLESFGAKPLRLKDTEYDAVRVFLAFIGTDENEIEQMLEQIPLIKQKKSRQRELAHFINYLAIENEISDLYETELSDREFIKWFPVYFWSKITFILPLRATEMLVTPFHCIRRDRNGIFIKVNRTMLKKKHSRVFYDVEKDYKIFEYRIPDSETVRKIEKYQSLTETQERKYLFEYSSQMVNHMLSLQAFNHLLESFTQTYLIGNRKYDYARYASGIPEFEVVSAGDSRPIAMSNLFYQDMGADICRQLANHTSINVSYGYFSNVSNTVMASSVMHMQRAINRKYHDTEAQAKTYMSRNIIPTTSFCNAPTNPKITGDVSECIAEDCLEDCLGCRYYSPSEQDLKTALDKRKEALDKASKAILETMAAGTELDGTDFDKVFLDAHTGIIRYKIACDESTKMEGTKWERYRNTTTKPC